MLGRIARKLRSNRFDARLRAANQYSSALLSLFFDLRSYIPLTPWSMSPAGVLQILNHIAMYRPKVVVEVGSGVSTVFVAKLIAQNRLATRLYSVEHDVVWLNGVKEWVSNEDAAEQVCFVHAPLTGELSYRGRPIRWYEATALDRAFSKSEVDFLIVDAPSGDLPYSRAGAFLYFANEIHSGKLCYFMDDAHRKEEKEIAEALGSNNRFSLDYVMGGKGVHRFDSRSITLLK
jgi:predicted O-methyltransferase YrrM